MTPRPEWLPSEGALLLGRFELTKWMGVGIHGGLFKATDRIFKKEVALKVFRPELFRDAARETNLFRLYRTRAYVHKHLLGVKDIFVTSEYVFLTEPYFACQNLREVLLDRRSNGKPFTKRELADLFSVLCNVLQWVHRIGVHGNIKPENILFAGADVRISDPYFLAGKANIPDPPAVMPAWDHYVAPEQAATDLEEIRQSDIYALGLVIGEMLLGAPVRPGLALSEQGPFFSNDLDAFFLKATARDPRARFGDVTTFWTDLRRIFQIEPAEWETSDVAGLIDLEDVDEDVVHAEEIDAAEEAAVEPAAPAPIVVPEPEPAPALAAQAAHAIATIEDEEPGFDESDEAQTVIASVEAPPAPAAPPAPEVAEKIDLSGEEPGFDTADVDFTVAEAEAVVPPAVTKASAEKPAELPTVVEPPLVEELIELDETDTTSHFEDVPLAETAPAPAAATASPGETVEIPGIPPIPIDTTPRMPEPDRRGETVEIGVPPLPDDALPPPLPPQMPAPGKADRPETRLMAAIPPPPDDVLEDLEPFEEEDLPVAALDELEAGRVPAPPRAPVDDDHLPVPSARLQASDDVVVIGHEPAALAPAAPAARPLTKAERKAQKRAERNGKGPAPLPQPTPAPKAEPTAVPRLATAMVAPRKGTEAPPSTARPAGRAEPHRPVARVEAERSSTWSIAVAILGVVALGAVIALVVLGGKKEPAPATTSHPAAVASAPAKKPSSASATAGKPVTAPAKPVAPAPAPATPAPATPAPTAPAPVAPAPATPAPTVPAPAAPAPAAIVPPAPAPVAVAAVTPPPAPAPKPEPPKPAVVTPPPAPAPKPEPLKPAVVTPPPAPAPKPEPPKPEPAKVAVVEPAAPAAPTACPGGTQKMTRTAGGKKVSYCIDRYEFPGKGSTPKTGVTWDGAQSACKAQGKRLCSAAEWSAGCGGKYPYGATYDPGKCNTAGEDDEERPLVPSGSKGDCKSPSGLYDMSGNVAEWVDEGTVLGGSSERDGEGATCGRSAKRFKGAGNAFVGFRCCSDLQ